MSGYEVISYDETTKTVILRMQSSGAEGLNGKKVSVKIDTIKGKMLENTIDTEINLSEIPAILDTETNRYNMSELPRGGDDEFMARKTIQTLKPDVLNIPLDHAGFATISNMGFINGELHIQTKMYPDDIHTSMGITLSGKNKQKEFQIIPVTITAHMIDGSIETYHSLTASDESKEVGFVTACFTPSLPLDISKVKSIMVDHTTIDLQ